MAEIREEHPRSLISRAWVGAIEKRSERDRGMSWPSVRFRMARFRTASSNFWAGRAGVVERDMEADRDALKKVVRLDVPNNKVAEWANNLHGIQTLIKN
jgi:hypothetical protein